MLDSELAQLDEIEEDIAELIRKEEDLLMEDADGTNADKTHLDPQETDTSEYSQASDTAEIVSPNGDSASNPIVVRSEKASNSTLFRGHQNPFRSNHGRRNRLA